MAKKVEGYIKLQIPAGKATPAPPVGPALGQHGVNIVEFTKQFNARTADKGDVLIPVVITVYADRSFSASSQRLPLQQFFLRRHATSSLDQLFRIRPRLQRSQRLKFREIAEMKMPDLNAASIEAAMSMIAGTARSMGIVHGRRIRRKTDMKHGKKYNEAAKLVDRRLRMSPLKQLHLLRRPQPQSLMRQ